jgi:ribonuclease I
LRRDVNTPSGRVAGILRKALTRRAAKLSRVHALFLVAALALLRPSQHADFGHYTFALTWQPGICSTDGGCSRNQPHTPLIGLHGLWASRPQALIARHVPVREWWSRGCDLYSYSDAPPPISPALARSLDAVMPHFRESLLTHEYDKHVRCFGFDPSLFFTTELRMRDAVVASRFGRYLIAMRGRRVARAEVSARFDAAFATRAATSLQLECGRNADGITVLTQLWITIRARALGAFPRSPSFVNAVEKQTNCPATFLVPDWERPHA